MATETQLQGASIPLMISGIEFQARTLTDMDFTELDNYIRARIVDIAYNCIKLQDRLPSERQELLSAAILAASKVSWYTAEGSNIMNDIDGNAKMAYQMCKPKKMTYTKFLELFKQNGQAKDNIERTAMAFNELNTNLDEDNKSEPKEDSDFDPKRS